MRTDFIDENSVKIEIKEILSNRKLSKNAKVNKLSNLFFKKMEMYKVCLNVEAKMDELRRLLNRDEDENGTIK